MRVGAEPPFGFVQDALPGEEFLRFEALPAAVLVQLFAQKEFGHGEQQVGLGRGHGRHLDEGNGRFLRRDAHPPPIAGEAHERGGVELSRLEDRQRGGQMIHRHPAVGITGDGHGGAADTAELAFIDRQGQWVRTDAWARSSNQTEQVSGVSGDPLRADAAMGRTFIDYKITNGVRQIRELMNDVRR